MIGNQTDAALAADRLATFRFSDEGSSREVYLINGVIYKINRNFYMDNQSEFLRASTVFNNLPEGYAIPEVALYGDVLAMEYIEGTLMGDCIDTVLGMECSTPNECIDANDSEILNLMGWDDQSYGNAIRRDGIIYLIDFS